MNNVKVLILLLVFLFGLTACGGSMFEDKDFAERQSAEEYAQERYLLAMEYMNKSRFEMARQQFSIAAASASSEELKEMSKNGYAKADAIIKGQR